MTQETTQTTNNNDAIKIIREVNIQAENFYEDAVRLGDHAAYALGRSHRSQMTGLENIAESALKTSDVFDYIKRQTARFTHWRQDFLPTSNNHQGRDEQASTVAKGGELPFGERLRGYLENDLLRKRDTICSKTRLNIGTSADEDRQRRNYIHLLLIRQFLRSMIIQYEYRTSFTNDNNTKRK